MLPERTGLQSRFRQLTDKIPFPGKKKWEQKRRQDEVDKLTDLLVNKLTWMVFEYGFTTELHRNYKMSGTLVRKNPYDEIVTITELPPTQVEGDYAVMQVKLKQGKQRYSVSLGIEPGLNQVDFSVHDEEETAPEQTGVRYVHYMRDNRGIHQDYQKDSRPGSMHELMSDIETLQFISELQSVQYDPEATIQAFQAVSNTPRSKDHPIQVTRVFWNNVSQTRWSHLLLEANGSFKANLK